MQNQQMLSLPTYDPDKMFDHVKDLLNVKSDLQLSLILECSPSQISKVRNFKDPLSDLMLIRLHEETGLSIRELRSLAGIEQGKIELKKAA